MLAPCDCAVRFIAQWDLTVGDLRAKNLWFTSSCRPFHISLEDADMGVVGSSSGLAVCSTALLMTAPASSPKAQLRLGPPAHPWFRLGLVYASSASGLFLLLHPLWTAQVSLFPGETREAGKDGWELLPEETLCQNGSI